MTKAKNTTKKTQKTTTSKFEGNLYDKIFKENAESIFKPLIEQQLGISIQSFQPLKEKMQTTIEREMDFFYIVEPKAQDPFILHLEFQVEDDHDMLYRGAEYHGMALRRKKMRMEHLVIYLAKKEPTMKTALPIDQIYKGFTLLHLYKDLKLDELLISQVPEMLVLAILCNFSKDKAEQVIRSIVIQLRAVAKNQNELSRYLKQLTILARLRKLEDLTTKIAEEMPITYNIETDYLYKRGIAKAKAEEYAKRVALLTKLKEEQARRKEEQARRKEEQAKRQTEELKRRLEIQNILLKLLIKGELSLESMASIFNYSLPDLTQLKTNWELGKVNIVDIAAEVKKLAEQQKQVANPVQQDNVNLEDAATESDQENSGVVPEKEA